MMQLARKRSALGVEEAARRCCKTDALFVAREKDEKGAPHGSLGEVRHLGVVSSHTLTRTEQASWPSIGPAFVKNEEAPYVRIPFEDAAPSRSCHNIDGPAQCESCYQWRRKDDIAKKRGLDNQ
jgi:hypothetical protein